MGYWTPQTPPPWMYPGGKSRVSTLEYVMCSFSRRFDPHNVGVKLHLDRVNIMPLPGCFLHMFHWAVAVRIISTAGNWIGWIARDTVPWKGGITWMLILGLESWRPPPLWKSYLVIWKDQRNMIVLLKLTSLLAEGGALHTSWSLQRIWTQNCWISRVNLFSPVKYTKNLNFLLTTCFIIWIITEHESLDTVRIKYLKKSDEFHVETKKPIKIWERTPLHIPIKQRVTSKK